MNILQFMETESILKQKILAAKPEQVESKKRLEKKILERNIIIVVQDALED